MDFKQLQYILTVAECCSVTKAAEQLYMSQPALSHFIQKTEAECGLMLFDRSTNPIRLTYAGEEYVKTARKILMDKEELIRKFRDMAGNRTGRLRLGIPRDRASYMLPVLLPSFAQMYPGIQVKTLTAGGDVLREQLLKGRIDFMILPGFVREANLEAHKIYEEELLLAAPKGAIGPQLCLDSQPDTVDLLKLRNFLELPLLLLPEGRACRSAIKILMKACHMKHQNIVEYDSNITLLRMAAAGCGIAIIPRMTMELTKCAQNVELFRMGNPPISWEIQVVYRKDAYIGQPERDLFQLATRLFNTTGLTAE